ncbi:transglycosylase SLT domain-containing protein [Xylophilus ampelinus]|uniref:Transglycosylase SLT domain-containing protein n=1 Tax=Xylophilus ampelinus TaxID=54067 RepID=A0A318SMI4_9BURK|nr:transglycosylase SLT domain-containing protein [Xylophilus ampelinus]MCS4509124.1 hypothetical protein [Xylophilus ampelinus]PYE79848.1 hypothetical protein DFQ15_101168 [Xylophilus ampelinus]
MTPTPTRQLQTDLAQLGLYTGIVDGDWGNQSATAWAAAMQLAARASGAAAPALGADPAASLAWGARVSQTFRDRIVWAADALKMPPAGASWLMACIAWESGETFSASVTNMAGSGATGLIQFMPATAVQLGTSTSALGSMTPEDQINWVYRYFRPLAGRLQNLGDVYMAILWPAGIGKPDSYVLWDAASRPTTYRQNAGLDTNGDRTITRAEALAKVQAKLNLGLLPINAAPLGAKGA